MRRTKPRKQKGYFITERQMERIEDRIDAAESKYMSLRIKQGKERTMSSKQLLRYLGV